jgi:uncharacterized protein
MKIRFNRRHLPLLGACLFAALSLAYSAWPGFADPDAPRVCFERHCDGDGCGQRKCVRVEVASSPEELMRGLMNRTSLPSDAGMIFIFKDAGIHPFWMKNTLIPLDMVWVSNESRIVHIASAVPCAADPCMHYTPRSPSSYVVEVNGGFAQEYGLRVGGPVSIVLGP